MNNYVESKQKLDEIRSKYMCAGDVILRTAIQMVVDYGRSNFNDDSWYNDAINGVNERHDSAEAAGKILFMTRSFEKAIFECAKELSQIESYDLLNYIQREIYLGGDGISYNRAIELLKDCINYLDYDPLNQAREIGFDDSEIYDLGFENLFEEEE